MSKRDRVGTHQVSDRPDDADSAEHHPLDPELAALGHLVRGEVGAQGGGGRRRRVADDVGGAVGEVGQVGGRFGRHDEVRPWGLKQKRNEMMN